MDAAICTSTGLNIVASTGQTIFRVARTQYGAINPPPRIPGEHPVEDWSRWDTPGRTIYGCTSATGAFVEVLEYIRPDPPQTRLTELFDDVDVNDAGTFAEQVARELPAHGGMPYRSISQGWRQGRSLYELRLPQDGWLVDVTGANSISVVSEWLGPTLLAECGVEELTLSELTSSAAVLKKLTTGIATWIRESIVLDDGARPHGVIYPSKWGTTLGDNCAMWLRRTDDGTGSDPLELIDTSNIGRHTKPFVDAAKLRGMQIF
ncbi:RES domain-containing protein [Mycobacterium sp. 236(2023)]|uniref:RES domain-containing protein n=1 Tax=Mycobacterium sp. 236(2023) TaxID=3038163 RepID=UPI0024151A5B|nr:RES domain-containing protein [Mycobacterium sp. 236(2023)]MDG4666373.1 RES domain-containing protein [Mycobacterium sp. 236(2023)]